MPFSMQSGGTLGGTLGTDVTAPFRIEIVVHETSNRRGIFEAWIGRRLVCRSREPLLATARILLAQGVPPDTRLEMRHRGSTHIALAGRIGRLARLTVAEDAKRGPSFRQWKPAPYGRGRSPMRFSDAPLPDIGSDRKTDPEG
jgi:hypothetical protein